MFYGFWGRGHVLLPLYSQGGEGDVAPAESLHCLFVLANRHHRSVLGREGGGGASQTPGRYQCVSQVSAVFHRCTSASGTLS